MAIKFDGRMQFGCSYDRALSEEEIKAIYRSFSVSEWLNWIDQDPQNWKRKSDDNDL